MIAASWCRYIRVTHPESKGPRGGRVTSTVVACVDCGRSVARRDPYPGSHRTSEVTRELREHGPCGSPRVPSDPARLLLALVGIMRDGGRIPLAFAVEWAGDGDIDGAVQRAWRQCRQGSAMAAVVNERQQFGYAHETGDGAEVRMRFSVRGVGVVLEGPQVEVANELRRLIPRIMWRDEATS